MLVALFSQTFFQEYKVLEDSVIIILVGYDKSYPCNRFAPYHQTICLLLYVSKATIKCHADFHNYLVIKHHRKHLVSTNEMLHIAYHIYKYSC